MSCSKSKTFKWMIIDLDGSTQNRDPLKHDLRYMKFYSAHENTKGIFLIHLGNKTIYKLGNHLPKNIF